jgi:hypothetical protein
MFVIQYLNYVYKIVRLNVTKLKNDSGDREFLDVVSSSPEGHQLMLILQGLQAEAEARAVENEALRAEAEAQAVENEALRAEAEAQAAENEALRAELRSTQLRNKFVEDDRSDSELLLEQNNQELARVMRANLALERELVIAQEKVDAVDLSLSERDQSIAELDRIIDNLHTHLRASQQREQAFQAQIKELNETINVLEKRALKGDEAEKKKYEQHLINARESFESVSKAKKALISEKEGVEQLLSQVLAYVDTLHEENSRWGSLLEATPTPGTPMQQELEQLDNTALISEKEGVEQILSQVLAYVDTLHEENSRWGTSASGTPMQQELEQLDNTALISEKEGVEQILSQVLAYVDTLHAENSRWGSLLEATPTPGTPIQQELEQFDNAGAELEPGIVAPSTGSRSLAEEIADTGGDSATEQVRVDSALEVLQGQSNVEQTSMVRQPAAEVPKLEPLAFSNAIGLEEQEEGDGHDDLVDLRRAYPALALRILVEQKQQKQSGIDYNIASSNARGLGEQEEGDVHAGHDDSSFRLYLQQTFSQIASGILVERDKQEQWGIDYNNKIAEVKGHHLALFSLLPLAFGLVLFPSNPIVAFTAGAFFHLGVGLYEMYRADKALDSEGGKSPFGNADNQSLYLLFAGIQAVGIAHFVGGMDLIVLAQSAMPFAKFTVKLTGTVIGPEVLKVAEVVATVAVGI